MGSFPSQPGQNLTATALDIPFEFLIVGMTDHTVPDNERARIAGNHLALHNRTRGGSIPERGLETNACRSSSVPKCNRNIENTCENNVPKSANEPTE